MTLPKVIIMTYGFLLLEAGSTDTITKLKPLKTLICKVMDYPVTVSILFVSPVMVNY